MNNFRTLVASMLSFGLVLSASCGSAGGAHHAVVDGQNGQAVSDKDSGKLTLALSGAAAKSKATNIAITLTQASPCAVSSLAPDNASSASIDPCSVPQTGWKKQVTVAVSDSPLEISAIPAGNIFISIQFLNADKTVLEEGYGYAEIIPGRLNQAYINLSPVGGSGDLEIIVGRDGECSVPVPMEDKVLSSSSEPTVAYPCYSPGATYTGSGTTVSSAPTL